MRTFILGVTASIGLGFMSPFIAYLGGGFVDPATHHGLFYAWYFAIPSAVDLAFLPGTAGEMLFLAIGVYVVQHLALFLLMWASLPAARVLHDFIARPRHRSGRLGR